MTTFALWWEMRRISTARTRWCIPSHTNLALLARGRDSSRGILHKPFLQKPLKKFLIKPIEPGLLDDELVEAVMTNRI
jgi:hypothetical protein